MTKEKLTLADSIPNSACWTIEEIADDVGLSVLRTRQVVEKAFKEKVVQKLFKKDGRRILYTPQMVDQLKKAMDNGRLGRFNKKRDPVKSAIHRAVLTLTVPVFDPEIAKLLKAKFKNDETAMVNFLKSSLEATVKPKLNALRELEEKFIQEKQRLLSEGLDISEREINV